MEGRRERGVTLVELLVALALIGLVASLGWGATRAIAGARVRGAAEQVASLLRRVGQHAWTERTPYRVVFTPGSAAIRVERWSGSAWVDARSAVLPDWLTGGGLLPAGCTVVSVSYPGAVYLAHPLTLDAAAQASLATTPGQVVVQAPGGAQLIVETTAAGEVIVR